MFKLKLILIALLSIGSLAAWFYVQHLRSENEILTLNNANLSQAADDLQIYIEELEADQKLKSQQARKRMEQIASLTAQSATLSKKLKEATRNDPVTTQCLAVRPGPAFVGQLRQYTQSVGVEGADEGVPGPVSLREPDPVQPHG